MEPKIAATNEPPPGAVVFHNQLGRGSSCVDYLNRLIHFFDNHEVLRLLICFIPVETMCYYNFELFKEMFYLVCIVCSIVVAIVSVVVFYLGWAEKAARERGEPAKIYRSFQG